MSTPPPSDLVLTSEAARILGVSGQTMRAWDRTNRFIPAMRTASGVRLYARGDLERMRLVLERQRCRERHSGHNFD